MSTDNTISLNLPPEMRCEVLERAAREKRTVNELLCEAVDRYLKLDSRWQELLAYSRAQGQKLGIQTEEDVERLSDEYRREKRA